MEPALTFDLDVSGHLSRDGSISVSGQFQVEISPAEEPEEAKEPATFEEMIESIFSQASPASTPFSGLDKIFDQMLSKAQPDFLRPKGAIQLGSRS